MKEPIQHSRCTIVSQASLSGWHDGWKAQNGSRHIGEQGGYHCCSSLYRHVQAAAGNSQGFRRRAAHTPARFQSVFSAFPGGNPMSSAGLRCIMDSALMPVDRAHPLLDHRPHPSVDTLQHRLVEAPGPRSHASRQVTRRGSARRFDECHVQ